MKTLGKLSGFAAVAGLSVMLAMPAVPAQAQTSVQTSDALLGAGTMADRLEHHLAADHNFDGHSELPRRRSG